MSREEGQREITYQMTMSMARQLLEHGLISKEEYVQFDAEMQRKYSPIIGGLFADIACYSADCMGI